MSEKRVKTFYYVGPFSKVRIPLLGKKVKVERGKPFDVPVSLVKHFENNLRYTDKAPATAAAKKTEGGDK